MTILSFQQASQSPRLYSFVQDAERFVRHTMVALEAAPLQVYCSALVFSPQNSIVKKQFRDQQPPWIKPLSTPIDQDWSRRLQIFETHHPQYSGLAFSPDSRFLASGYKDNMVALWDLATGTTKLTLGPHSDNVASVAFSPSGRLLAAASFDGVLVLWNIMDGTLNKTLAAPTDQHNNYWVPATTLFSPDGNTLAPAYHTTLILWDPISGTRHHSFTGSGEWIITDLSFSRDGRLLALGAKSYPCISLWDCETGSIHQILTPNASSSFRVAVAFSPVDDETLATGFELSGQVDIWRLGETPRKRTLPRSGVLRCIEFSSDGGLLALATDGDEVELWDPARETLFDKLVNPEQMDSHILAFSADGKLFASLTDGSNVVLWDFAGQVDTRKSLDALARSHPSQDGENATAAVPSILQAHECPVHHVTVSANGQLLASAEVASDTIRLWNIETRAFLREFHCPCLEDTALGAVVFDINALAVSPNASLLAAGLERVVTEGPYRDSPHPAPRFRLQLWEVQSGQSLWERDTDTPLDQISFDTTGTQLQTEQTVFELPQRVCHELANCPPLAQSGLELEPFYGTWVKYRGAPILWLPPSYQPKGAVTGRGIVAVGHQSGRITILELDEDAIPCGKLPPSSPDGLPLLNYLE